MKKADESSRTTEQNIPSPSKRPRKLYYKIGEVCELTGLPHHVIRFWEKEFSQLTPRKTATGHRIFNDKDIETLLLIKDLLYVRKYTIKGAREFIFQGGRHEKEKLVPAVAAPAEPRLNSMVNRLVHIKKLLERKPPN
jgi:DNA-binding transcriptional MerR regulator